MDRNLAQCFVLTYLRLPNLKIRFDGECPPCEFAFYHSPSRDMAVRSDCEFDIARVALREQQRLKH